MFWSFILKMFVSLALQSGLPYALQWLHSRFPFLPASIDEIIRKLIDAITNANETPMTAKQRTIAHAHAKKQAAEDLKNCVGGICERAYGAMKR